MTIDDHGRRRRYRHCLSCSSLDRDGRLRTIRRGRYIQQPSVTAGGALEMACRLRRRPFSTEIEGKKYSAKRIGFVKKPISKKDMLGNIFEIGSNEQENWWLNY